MVRVLAAAPERRSKIYSLSRRPPPETSYTDLGVGGKRMEDVSVDFLGDVEGTKGALGKIDRVVSFSSLQRRFGRR